MYIIVYQSFSRRTFYSLKRRRNGKESQESKESEEERLGGEAMPPLGYKKWNNQYRRVMFMHERGMDNREIGKKMNMHPCTVSGIVHSPRYKEKVKEFQDSVAKRARKLFEDKALAAAEKIVKISETGKSDERLQFDAAKEILYQVGVKPVEVIETRKREYTPEEIESALEISREVAAITERLGKSKSPFLLEEEETESTSPAPVPSTTDEIEGEDVKPDNDIHETGVAGQETVSEKPVLPV